MDVIRSSAGVERLVGRCRRLYGAIDRGWKATALGVAIVVALSLAP